MLSPFSLILIALVYMALLFAIAWVGDKQRIAREHRKIQAGIYSLSLAVYCTSWTFYGAVGSAATTGWGFLPIYLGPALVFLLGHDLIRRIAVKSRDQRITSIADYIAFRYGRSHTIAVLVTLAAVVGSIPYIALQLKGITTGFEVIGRSTGAPGPLSEHLSLYIALSLVLFAMLFGTRNMDASEHHRGLMWAIAFESLVKLLAFLSIGLFVIFGIFDGLGDVAATLRDSAQFRELFSPWRLPEGFGIQLTLAMAAILCLPRQFHVAVVEFRNVEELRVARWVFPAYLMLFAMLVIPIALAGLSQFSGQGVNPDTYVLSLPIAFDQEALTVLAFLGGFSAATGMVIVATVALAIMVSNDIVMPLLLRSGLVVRRGDADLSQTLLRVRRVSILVITLLAYAYFRAIESGVPMASIGLLSFSAAAQFAPAMLIGLYWRGATRVGAIFGLTVGVSSWFFLLLLPSLGNLAGDLPRITFNQGAAWSLIINAVLIVVVSLLAPESKPAGRHSSKSARAHGGLLTLGELQGTISQFLGVEMTSEALATHLGTARIEPGALASPATVQFGERLLAGSIGSASARTVLSTALQHRGLGHRDVMELLDRTSQAVQFNRELLEATLDNMSQAVAVVDHDLRLVGWNRRYLQVMEFPESLVHLGQPIEELIRYNATRGMLGEGDITAEIRKRLEHLRSGSSYRYERTWFNGSVIEMQGNPMPGGGYVTTYTDITHFKEIERKLQEINETLEQRVLQRTRELSDAIREVEKARQSAVEANQSKTRFLAAASHDLLQPMNAARLFVSILREHQQDPESEQAQLVKRVDRSLSAAEDLLSALLDISKLDSDMHRPDLEAISIAELFEQLRRRFKPLALNRNLKLRVRPAERFVYSDRKLLYRILQNFLANAIRYTERGGVLLGCRVRKGQVQLSVWDTGVGIDAQDSEAIFQEFHRLEYAQRLDERGLGLGLAICDRIARILKHDVSVSSRPGHGSCFSVSVPLATAEIIGSRPQPTATSDDTPPLEGLVVLCVDNEPEILDGMKLLLERWGCTVWLAANRGQAEQRVKESGAPHFLLLDYHLGEQYNGIDVAAHIDTLVDASLPAIVITADRSAAVEDAARDQGYSLLRKPIKPAALRTLISNMLKSS
jgi:Na+/proline symporter/signal transduction histidine kinase